MADTGGRGPNARDSPKNRLSTFPGMRYRDCAKAQETWNASCVNGSAMGNTMRFERCASPQSTNELAFLGEPALSPERVQEGVLVRRILAGEPELFAKLMQPCSRQIKAVAFRALGNRPEVDDIAQETALKAFTSLDQFRQEGRFQTWVTSIAVNEVRQFLRSSRSHRLESLDAAYTDSQSESWRKFDLIQRQERPATECVFHRQVNELLRK